MADNLSLAVDNTPKLLNDAEILGIETPAFCDLLGSEATFLLGELWGQRDRRNTQDGDWKPMTLNWGDWIGGQEGDRNAPEWGFSRHPVGKHKEGSCIVLGSSVGGARKAKAMNTMYALALDIDSGVTYADAIDKLEELGYFALAYTTFSHDKCGIELKRDEVLRKLGITHNPSDEEVRDYLRRFDKNRYEDAFVGAVTIAEQKHQTTEGVKIVLDTPPLEKFRLIFPLAKPVKLIDLADTHEAALGLWEDTVTGLARNVLGMHFDTSCTDPSRLFFLPRHAKGATWDCTIVQGDPLIFSDIKPMNKSAYSRTRESNPFTIAGGMDSDRPKECYAPSGASLNDWHRNAKDRFMLADLMETLCPDKIRVAGGEAQGHVHTECPFEHEHTSEGGTATMAINSIDSQNEYWTWFCHHDACQGRHKLEFLEEALRAGWFEEDALYDIEQGFLLDVADGEDDPFAPLPHAVRDETKTPEQRATAFTTDSTEAEIEKFIKGLWREGADKTTRANVVVAIAENTNLTRHDVKAIWKKLDADHKKREREKSKGDRGNGAFTDDPAPALTRYAMESVKAANDCDPFLFEYMEAPAIVRRGRLKSLDFAGRRHALGKVTVFYKPKGHGDPQHIYPPDDVVNDLFASDLSEFLLPLRGVVNTPFFAADGTLVTENGYHAGSQVYLDSDLVLSGVSPHPTDEEVQVAKRFIVENVLADFPLDGLSRAEIMESLEGGKVPAVTHAMGLCLLPFMRDMIDGPTPGWSLVKPAPGTGASLLIKLLTTIASGTAAPETAFPTKQEEVSKTLTSLLQNGPTHIVFDNIDKSISSPELASALTAKTYQARILGKSQTVAVDVRSIFTFTANNLEANRDILRRFVFIPLDAKMDDPESRRGFQHPHVEAWVNENRAQLVHACLTIIANWVASGMNRSKSTLASFEDWAAVTGGVLEAAGFTGFLEGQQEAQAMAADAAQNNVRQLMDVLSDYPDSTLFRPGGKAKFNGENAVSLMDVLNGSERATIEVGDSIPDPIQLNGWGYNEFDGGYKASGRIGLQFDKLARKPHRGGGYILSFEALDDTRNKGKVYRMTKEAQKPE